ncbi:RNA-directed DNA polymerase, eukaryota [Artemisia annua]|uniref:RNA-directed DNA polymerase, eukaryota n=1 Tax=Artemisia annua TaxID=35608 RepID=A0A2U1MFY5_ARTAN|nr:RNA-directed DNA polymerase, eukaryota [Artemisia annua]
MEEEWQDVLARRNKGRQNNKGEAEGAGDVTKFFVSNLPSGCTPWEVSEFLGYYGEVVGSYIAKKRDKEGKRFGFITFRKVRNALELEKRMNGIKMGICKLKVNVAKFAVENIGLRELEERAGRKQENPEMPIGRKQEKQEVERQNKVNEQTFHPGVGLSFKAVLNGKSSVGSGVHAESSCRSIKVPDNVVAFFERVGGLNIVYVGWLSLLLNFHDKDDAVDLMLKKDVWSKWFSVLDFWESQSLPFERVAWLKIHGVPINLATNEVFDEVASQFGKIVHPSQLNLEDGDISVGLVGILVGDGKKINESVNLRWTNKVFKTWITEEVVNWEPECVGAVGKREVEVAAVSDDNSGEPLPEKVYDSKSEADRVESESLDELLEEGEFRESMHGEEGDNNNLHGISQGVINEKVVSELGEEVEVEKVNNTHFFKASNRRLKSKRRPNKISKKRSQRVQSFTSSPLEVVRPKKRSRQEDSDPFDLDRFIGIIHNDELEDGDSQNRSVDNKVQCEDGGSFDLNKEASVPESSDTKDIDGGGGEEAVEQGVKDGIFLDKEVEATVSIGAMLADHDGLVPWLNKLKKDNGVDFLAIQESKAEDLSNFEGKCIWGNKNYGMEFVGSVVGFEEAVCSAARVVGVVAPPNVILTKKFGQIRDSIKRWKEEMLRIESAEEEDARAEIEKLEVDMEIRGLSEEEEWIYAEIGANINRISNWKPVFDVFESRLSKWKADCLSIGERVTLIKSVLESLLAYFFSLYKAPCKVIKDLESFISRFLWGGSKEVQKIHWVAWDRVCTPKKCGGLGLCKLKFINVALLAKWGWRFKKERDSMDSWVWIGVGDGVFSVSAVRKQLYYDMDFSNITVFEWCKWILKKCNIFGWRAEMGRIPTATALRHRNIPIADVSCVLCGSADESVDHLFTGCIFATRLWQHISSWCNVQNIFAFSFKDLLEVHNFVGLSGRTREIFYGIIIIGC